MSARVVACAVFAIASVVWAASIAAAPVMIREREPPTRWQAAAAIYAVGAIVCHQRAERSFHTAGVRWPVCGRCTGIYAGAATGLLLWPAVRRRRLAAGGRLDTSREPHRAKRLRAFTLAVAVPTLFTVATAALGVFDLSNAWRAALALPLGAWTGAVLSAVLLGDLR